MNNLAYANQKPEHVGNKIEELLRDELGVPGPFAREVVDEGAGPAGLRSMLHDAGKYILSGEATRLFSIRYHFMTPRETDVEAHLIREGLGCYCGSLIYATKLGKRVAGDVIFGDDGKFTGDAAAAGRLNANKDVLKKCDAFAVTRGGLTGFKLKIPRYLKLLPNEGGAQLVAATLPKSKAMGFSATLRSKEFFELVTQIEAEL